MAKFDALFTERRHFRSDCKLAQQAIRRGWVSDGDIGLTPKLIAPGAHTYRIGRVPRHLIPIGDRLEARFGRLGRDYAKVCFDKIYLTKEPTLEWITPGHPLFEVVRESLLDNAGDNLQRGAIFYDLNRDSPAVLDVFAASIKDGRGSTLHRRLFVVETASDGAMTLRQPTIFHEVTPAPAPKDGAAIDSSRADLPLVRPPRQAAESHLVQHALEPWLAETQAQRGHEIERIARHVEISLNALIDRQQRSFAELETRRVEGRGFSGIEGQIAQIEQHLDDLNNRLENRRRELDMERHATISDITHLGRAAVVPHPDRSAPELAPMVRDEEVERRAIAVVIGYEEARGWVVEDVQKDRALESELQRIGLLEVVRLQSLAEILFALRGRR